MKHAPPAPPELGTVDGLAYALFLPDGDPATGVVVLHGAGSAKESHFDFARGCRAEGMVALAFDARGHGRSAGVFGPDAIEDVLTVAELVRAHAPRVAVRGSSMGGFQAIHAAARDPSFCAVVAICPAQGGGGAVGLRLAAARAPLSRAAPLRLRRAGNREVARVPRPVRRGGPDRP
jgi:uncharacterized protein